MQPHSSIIPASEEMPPFCREGFYADAFISWEPDFTRIVDDKEGLYVLQCLTGCLRRWFWSSSAD